MSGTVWRDGYGDLRVGWSVAAFMLAFCVAAVVVCAAIVAVAYPFSRHGCEKKAEAMGREWRYGLWTDCLIRTDGGVYVPLDKYRLTDQERGR